MGGKGREGGKVGGKGRGGRERERERDSPRLPKIIVHCMYSTSSFCGVCCNIHVHVYIILHATRPYKVQNTIGHIHVMSHVCTCIM